MWGCGRPSSGCPSAMVPHSLGRPHFLHGFSWRGDPHSHPLCGICTTDSGPLPGSALLTPQFSTQPLPAWVASCLRQERSGLIPEEALAWVAFRTPEPVWVEEPLVLAVGKPAQVVLLPMLAEARTGGWRRGLQYWSWPFCITPQWHLASILPWPSENSPVWNSLPLPFRMPFHKQ